MPCYTPPPTEEENRAHYYRTFEHNSPLAQILCTLCADYVPEAAFLHVPGLRQWWTAHKERDTRLAEAAKAALDRREAEAKARAKLTPAERKLLGVK